MVAELGDFRHRPRAAGPGRDQLLNRSRPDVKADERKFLQNCGGDCGAHVSQPDDSYDGAAGGIGLTRAAPLWGFRSHSLP